MTQQLPAYISRAQTSYIRSTTPLLPVLPPCSSTQFKYSATTPTKASFYIQRLVKASYTATAIKMQNKHGQGASHTIGNSKVPGKVQEKVTQGLEEGLPNSVCYSFFLNLPAIRYANLIKIHDTGSKNQGTSGQTHAKDGGDASIVPKGIQKAVPENLERALPNAIHGTGHKQ